MARVPNPVNLDFRTSLSWNYSTGLELYSFLKIYEKYGVQPVYDYVKAYADTMIHADGSIYGYEVDEYNIDHVTITINCIDPEVGAKIYPWIFWQNRRIRGVEGAKILIEQQQKGLEACIAKGILVKVNSVMIPGVNDEHLKEVSRVVKSKGAFLHNVMPLIAEAEHGTFYGLTGQRSPTQDELQALQGQQWQKNQPDDDHAGTDGGRDFDHRTVDAMQARTALFVDRLRQMLNGVFDHHDARIDQHADGDRQAAETHQIGRQAKHTHQHEGPQGR